MSNSRRWIFTWFGMALWVAVLISCWDLSPQREVFKQATPPMPTLAMLHMQPLMGLSTNRRYESQTERTYIENQETKTIEQLREQEISERKKMAHDKMSRKRANDLYLLASRSIHLMKYAQYEKMERGKQVAKNAEHFLGTPYAWGGTSPHGFDCSGFTQYVYAQYGGVKVPRNSYDQYAQGKPVSRQELMPGDLVFFTTYAPGPSHLGIYIGDGKFVHALNPEKGVILSTLDADYYKQRFLGGRRVL